MTKGASKVVKTYLTLTLFSTLAASLIWGINTLFLLDAGLNATQAFAANAFFTAGMVLFEIPTGVIADTWGRRTSYLLGSATLAVSTGLYYLLWAMGSPLWQWAIVSMLLGLGFTFFSGATEAWLVDALKFNKYTGTLDSVLAKGQVIGGAAMLTGSVAGGIIAQTTSLGVPFIIRGVLLILSFTIAYTLMFDQGFDKTKVTKPVKQMKRILGASVDNGLKNKPVKWLMLAAPFSSGVGIFAFYAMQPYLLELYGDPTAYSVAGIAAAVIAGAQIGGGLAVKWIQKIFKKRTTFLMVGIALSALVIVALGLTNSFIVACSLLVVWALVFAATMPIRQSYINGVIPSEQRATVLSFDALMGSVGGVAGQPALGKVADVYSYSTAYVVAGSIQIIAFPFVLLSRRTNSPSDTISHKT